MNPFVRAEPKVLARWLILTETNKLSSRESVVKPLLEAPPPRACLYPTILRTPKKASRWSKPSAARVHAVERACNPTVHIEFMLQGHAGHAEVGNVTYALMVLRKQRVYYEPQRRACTLDFLKCVFPPGAITQQSRHSVILLSYVIVVRATASIRNAAGEVWREFSGRYRGYPYFAYCPKNSQRSYRTEPNRPSFECVTLLTLSGYAVTYQRFGAERPPDGAPPIVKKH